MMAKNGNALGIPVGHMSQAVSDGELNMSTRGCGGSSSSLPGTPAGEVDPTNRVLSWAVSFEKLLEDPSGVQHFTSFLKSEVSAENILFWQACEKFRKIPATSVDELKTHARAIYDTYLSESAPHSVNIDDTAKTEKEDLEQPAPDMFSKAQAQIFKLMKMDSYRRFVRSPVYQRCTLASVEGKLLPQLDSRGSWEDMIIRSPLSDKKKTSDSCSMSEKRNQKRGSWGVDGSNNPGLVPRKDTHMTAKSSSSVELGSLYRQIENGRSSPRFPEQGGGGGGSRSGLEGGYCCVYLPDGSASLAPTRNGQLIKDMLASLCEKRGFPQKDVIIYLHGKDKPLSLDQDCCVLRDQQVTLELRVKFALEIAFTGKTVGIMVKSSKTLQDALSAVLQKHSLKQQDALVTIAGSNNPVSMTSAVFKLANKTLRLDRKRAGGTATTTQAGVGRAGDQEARSLLQTDRAKAQNWPQKNRDIDGILDMLTKAQCYRVDDQRGLLTKEQLEVPLFLQLSLDQRQADTEPDKAGTAGSSTADSEIRDEKTSLKQSSAGETEESPAQAAPRDLKETSV